MDLEEGLRAKSLVRSLPYPPYASIMEEAIARGGRPAHGFGIGSLAPPTVAASVGVSSVALALASSVATAATGWAMERALVAAMGRVRGRS